MKTKLIILALMLGSVMMTMAQTKELQEHRFKKTTGTLLIEIGLVNLEGYNGNEVIISRMVEKQEKDPRAEGLVGLSASGFHGEGGEMGLNVLAEGEMTRVRLSGFGNRDTVFIKVPEHLHVIIKEAPLSFAKHHIQASGMKGELEISGTNGNIGLKNITGPVTARTAMGNIEAIFDAPVKGPVSFLTTMGYIDVSLPKSTKAQLDLYTMTGQLFAAPELGIEVVTENVSGEEDAEELEVQADKVTVAGRGSFSSVWPQSVKLALNRSIFGGAMGFNSKVKGTLNGGGGEDIVLHSNQGKIYLREAVK